MPLRRETRKLHEGNRILALAVLHPDANVEGSPSAARDEPKRHRRWPRRGLQQPEPFRARVPARGRRFTYGLSPIGSAIRQGDCLRKSPTG